jgi:hypothetical protein
MPASLFDAPGVPFDALRRAVRALRGCAVPHLFIGGVALRAHGVEEELELVACLRPADIPRFTGSVAGELGSVPGRPRLLYDLATQRPLRLVAAGEPAGDPFEFPDVRLPDPDEAVMLGGVPVPPLWRLLELLLAAGELEAAATLLRVRGMDAAPPLQIHASLRGRYDEARITTPLPPGE